MNYKYRKQQIFGKRLNVPKNILDKVYSSSLSFDEFIDYQLDDKIPISCIRYSDRKIVEKFGIDKCRGLDWELINNPMLILHIDIRDALMSIDSQIEDINKTLYESVKNQISPKEYSSKMRELYPNMLFDVSKINDNNLKELAIDFNNGLSIDLKRIIDNWKLFKEKDLSYCLQIDKQNKNNITTSMVEEFMSKYEDLAPLIAKNNDIYEFIYNISLHKSEEEKSELIKQSLNSIITEIKNQYKQNRGAHTEFTNKQFREIFKYFSLSSFLNELDETRTRSLIKELNDLPQDYIFNIPIPFSELLNPKVLNFINLYGLKNIADFDNECGHFFTKNNCEMLKLMDDMYIHYGNNIQDDNKKIFTKNVKDENGKYIDKPYTKDEFYEAMKRMIIYGPTDYSFASKAPDYRNIIGEFRTRNAELFISEKAPEELQQCFYTKSITPQLLRTHPEYAQFLNGKDLSSCFKTRYIKVQDKDGVFKHENLYNYLLSKTDFNGVINFITEYCDALDIIFDGNITEMFQHEVVFNTNDDISQIQNIINEKLRKIILEEEKSYPAHSPQKFVEQYPSMFLDKNAPQELQDAFYKRDITSSFLLSNPDYNEFLSKVDLELLFKYMPLTIINKENGFMQSINLISHIRQIFGPNDAFNVALVYGPYIEKVFEDNKFRDFKFNPSSSNEELLNELDKSIYYDIIDGNMSYDERIPSHFKNKYPTLFLNQNVSLEIKNKFYKKKFTLEDFENNPELFEIFGNTNIVCGFPKNVSWAIQLFSDVDNSKMANKNRLKVISAFYKIKDESLRDVFRDYVLEFINDIDVEKIDYISEVLLKLSLSNSSEIFTFRKEIATQVLKTDNPIESLNKIEDVFIKNNIPIVGKVYSCFEILHPDFKGFDFVNSNVSPVLEKESTINKKITVFSDLVKCSFGSNNRSVNAYLKNIEYGFNLYENIRSGLVQFDSLSEADKQELTSFSHHLATLYNNSMKAKKANDTFISSGDILVDILELSKKISSDGTLDYNIADRVIRMFCGFAGISTIEQAKKYIDEKIKMADSRNRAASNKEMLLEEGDFIKGIGSINYLRNILQNGSVSKEYLGSSTDSDSTPLDTDVSRIMISTGTIDEKMRRTAALNYGPIWFILKNDDRFFITRNNNDTLDVKNDMSKIEAFYTGVLGADHYGIRTGFASSEINYILIENYDPRIGLEIAMNGFYIPVANKEGKIVFTPKDYDKLREKMSGLSYYGNPDYTFSENLVTEDTEYLSQQIEQSNYEASQKKQKINDIIRKSIEELGLELKTNIDGDLTEGFVELIDTGSTGRGTNKPGDGDFDFMMRLDKTILTSPSKLSELKHLILKNFDKEHTSQLTDSGDFRLKGVQIDADTNVDIDITFTEKTDKVIYSTDMSLQDRLKNINRIDPEKYKYVVANILLAKQVLKKAEVYKPNRGEIPQGGLGGVGIENWILQNGGSFIDAAESFVEAAEGKNFSDFAATYQIWDFGDNHLAEKRGQYVHDNFVANNMNEEGYEKMVTALKEYLKLMEISNIKTESIKL